MSTRRLSTLHSTPHTVKRAFHKAPKPRSEEEALWRERTARMCLDAMGHTNITRTAHEHNYTVAYARHWLRHTYDAHGDDVRATFDCAGLDSYFNEIKAAALAVKVPIRFSPGHERKNFVDIHGSTLYTMGGWFFF